MNKKLFVPVLVLVVLVIAIGGAWWAGREFLRRRAEIRRQEAVSRNMRLVADAYAEYNTPSGE